MGKRREGKSSSWVWFLGFLILSQCGGGGSSSSNPIPPAQTDPAPDPDDPTPDANQIPIADDQSVLVNINTSKSITLTGLDPDGDSLSFVIVAQPANGTLDGAAPEITYTPDPDYRGTDSFTFRVNDRELDSALAICTLDVKRIYFVATNDLNASDSNPGTEILPFKTIQKAANVVQAGELVFIKAGTYAAPDSPWRHDPVLRVMTSGTAAAPIRFQNFNNDIVIIDGYMVDDDGNINDFHRQGIYIPEGADYIEIAGLVVKNARREGILVEGGHVLIEDCIVEECGRIQANAASTGIQLRGCNYYTVRRCVVRYSYAGIIGWGSADGLIEDCIAHHNGFFRSGEPIYPENADGIGLSIARTGSDNVTVRRSVAFANGDDQFDGSHSRDSLFDSCYSFDGNIQNHPRGDGGGFKVGNHGTDAPIAECWRLLVRNCVTFNNNFEGFGNRNAPENTFLNSTSYANATEGFRQARTTRNCVAAQNANQDALGGQSENRTHNFWADGQNLCPTCMSGDPLFVNPDGVIDTSWQGGFDEYDVRGILPTLNHIRSQVEGNFSLQAIGKGFPEDSPCIDAGAFATLTTVGGEVTIAVIVADDPRNLFRVGDPIQVQDATGGADPDHPGRATIIMLSDTTITVDQPLTFESGKGVHLPWSGSAPDLGAFEFEE